MVLGAGIIKFIKQLTQEAITPGTPFNERLMNGQPNIVKTMCNFDPNNNIDDEHKQEYKSESLTFFIRTVSDLVWDKHDKTIFYLYAYKGNWEEFIRDQVYNALCFNFKN